MGISLHSRFIDRILQPMGTTDAIEFLVGKLKETKTNADFFTSMNQ